MSASQRRKGANGELELCALLNADLGTKAKRKLGQAREAGNDVDLPPFRIEVKRRARIGNVYDWMAQCSLDAAAAEIPVVAMRADGKKWLVLMDLPTFCKLAREEISFD